MVCRRVFTLVAALLTATTGAALGCLGARWRLSHSSRSTNPAQSSCASANGGYIDHLTGPGQVISYSIGAARPGIQFFGRTVVTQKRERTIWIPTRNQRRLYRGLPSRVVPGPDNPIGSRVINLAQGNL